jgi:REP element-mobilizing transposase RayT
LKARPGIASFRIPAVWREAQASFAKACERGRFRLVHYSIQDDHTHLIVEAADPDALGRGMKSLAARFARAVNRALGRSGPVLKDRYHLHVLRTPLEVRRALAYVLLNARKHWAARMRRRGRKVGATPLDPVSSARWFDGWRRGGFPVVDARDRDVRAVATARTWLATTGWRIHGLLDPLEVPGGWRAEPNRSAPCGRPSGRSWRDPPRSGRHYQLFGYPWNEAGMRFTSATSSFTSPAFVEPGKPSAMLSARPPKRASIAFVISP